jgi:hypothetical protein
LFGQQGSVLVSHLLRTFSSWDSLVMGAAT